MKFYLKKIFTLIITLFIISGITFFVFEIIPGDRVLNVLGTDATPEMVEAMREELGLNRPVTVRYADWLKDAVKGDFGTSYNYSVEVSSLLKDKLPVTLTLAAMSLILIIFISFPLGILWASVKKPGGRKDTIAGILSQIIMSIPSFFLGIIIIWVLGIILKVFAPGGYISYSKDMTGFIKYMFFPAVTIAISKSAQVVRFLRNSLIKEKKADYVRTAYSKGAAPKKVMYGHVLRNGMIPVVTFLGTIVADVMAGSIVVEQVYSVPGIGRLLITSISTRDFPVVQAIILYIVFIIIIVNFVVDMLYQLLDPRISQGHR